MPSWKKLTSCAGAVLLAISGSAAGQQPVAPPSLPRPQPVQQTVPATAPAQIELPQSTTATYGNWVVQCQTRAGPPPEKICDMAQVTQVQGNSAPFSRVAVAQLVKGQAVKLVVLVPVNAPLRPMSASRPAMPIPA